MSGLSENLLSIPPVTRFFLLTSLAVCLGVSTNVFSFENLIPTERLDTLRSLVYGQAKLTLRGTSAHSVGVLSAYKLFSQFFVVDGLGNSGVSVLLNIYRFYTSSNNLESSRGRFRGNFPDYLWFVLVCGTLLIFINLAFEYVGISTFYFHSQLSSCITYMWSRAAMNTTINFLGAVPIKAYYLPLFDLGVALMSGGSHPGDSLSGILAGYFYQCIQSDTLPVYNLMPGAYESRLSRNDGRRVGFNVDTVDPNTITPAVFDMGYWKAPAAFYRLLNYPLNTSVRSTAFTGTAPAAAPPKARTSGYEQRGSTFRGKGHRLGT